jgi:hypothetical protein
MLKGFGVGLAVLNCLCLCRTLTPHQSTKDTTMKKHMTMRRLPWNAVARSLGSTTSSRCAAGLRVRGTATTTSSSSGSAASAADRLKQLTQLKPDFDPLGKEVEKKLVNVTINGTPRQVAEGLSIVEACRLFKVRQTSHFFFFFASRLGAYVVRVGCTQVEVPTLCYHPMLTIVGQCRLCLVQLANRQGKLVAGCATHVEEGMDIITESETLTQNGTRPYVSIPSHTVLRPAQQRLTAHTTQCSPICSCCAADTPMLA